MNKVATTSSQIVPGMNIFVQGKVYLVESCVKVTVSKGLPFIKTKLKNLVTGEEVEKNFKIDQELQEVVLTEGTFEFLYLEGDQYLFLDVGKLDILKVPVSVVDVKANFLKEGVEIKAMMYGDSIFSIELPQFLELMVAKVEDESEDRLGNSTKVAVLETGAKIEVPLFIEPGDIIKVDTQLNDYVQRV